MSFAIALRATLRDRAASSVAVHHRSNEVDMDRDANRATHRFIFRRCVAKTDACSVQAFQLITKPRRVIALRNRSHVRSRRSSCAIFVSVSCTAL